MPWHAETFAKQVDEILIELDEVPLVDAQVRFTFQKILYRAGKFGTDGRGDVTLLIRTITESSGNENALVEPIITAVALVMRPEWTNLGLRWIKAFDQIPLMATLQTMRSLNLFSERSMALYLSMVIRNKLAAILKPVVSKPAPVRAKPKAKRPKRRPADQPVRRMAA